MTKPTLVRVRSWVHSHCNVSKFTRGNVLNATKNSLAVVGAVSVFALSGTYLNDDFASAVASILLPASSDMADAGSETDPIEVLLSGGSANRPSPKAEKQMVNYLSSRFRVSPEGMTDIVRFAFDAAEKYKLDPALVLAVASVESGFNPYAASPMGAKGLMQVMAQMHAPKFEAYGDIKNASINPQINMLVGAEILKDAISRGGSVSQGLKYYLGVGEGQDDGYVVKVLAEASRIRQAAGSKTMAVALAKPTMKHVSKPAPAKTASKASPESKRAAAILSDVATNSPADALISGTNAAE
jgi:hypothetical protein